MNRLRTHGDFNNAFLKGRIVHVYLDDEHQDCGPIEEHILTAVRINGFYYVKDQCEFYLKD